jgi:hypothetical protein
MNQNPSSNQVPLFVTHTLPSGNGDLVRPAFKMGLTADCPTVDTQVQPAHSLILLASNHPKEIRL